MPNCAPSRHGHQGLQPRSHSNRGAAGPTRSAGSPDSGGHRLGVSIVRRVTQVLLVVIGLLLIGLPLLALAANQARVSPRLLVWDRPGMRFGSWQAQTALVIMVIALALA